MGEVEQTESDEVVLSRQAMVPIVHRVGDGREIETTFLGNNAFGQPTWVLWNPQEPYLIGVLREGKAGYTFEQRTSQGVMLHEGVSFKKVQKMLLSGGAG